MPPAGAAEPGGPSAELSPAALPDEPAARLAELQRRLRAVSDFRDESIPRAARPVLVEIRKTSIRLVRSTLDELAQAEGGRLGQLNDVLIERAIETKAAAAGVDLAVAGEQRADNGLWYASVTRSKINPRVLVVGFYFAVPCGSDGGYVVYDIGQLPARPLLTLASPDAGSIEPMYWNLAFAVPPPGKPQDLFFVATRMTPWCQSALRQLELLVFRPSDDPDAPAKLLDVTVEQHLLRPVRLDVTASSIELETDDGTQSAARRWKVEGDRVTQVVP